MPENAAHARERYAGKCNARKLGRYAVACLPLVLGHALPLRRHAQSAGGRQPRALHRTSVPDRHCPKGAAAADGTRQQQLNMRRNGLKYNAGPPTLPLRGATGIGTRVSSTRLRASRRPVRLRGRWAHTRYYQRLLTHIKTGALQDATRRTIGIGARVGSPVHVASGSLCGRPRRRVRWGWYTNK